MNNLRNRIYPRVHDKNINCKEESAIDISMKTALGIIAVVFLKGMFWGYILKRSLD